MTIIAPFTGEVIDENDLEELERVELELDRHLRDVGPLYGTRTALRSRIAELREAAKLPPPRFRSEVQHNVAKCPRCSARIT